MYDETYDFNRLTLDHQRTKARYRRHRAGKIKSKEKQIKAKPNRNILRRIETQQIIPGPELACTYIKLERIRHLDFNFILNKDTYTNLKPGPLIEIIPYPEVEKVHYFIYDYRTVITFLDQDLNPIANLETNQDLCSQKGSGTFPKDFLEPIFLKYFDKTPDQVLTDYWSKDQKLITIKSKYQTAYIRYLKAYKSSRWYNKLDLVTKRRVLDRHVLSQTHSANLLNLDDRLDDALHSLPKKDKMDYRY